MFRFHFYLKNNTQLSKPILGSCEHDPLALWEDRTSSDKKSWPEPPPPATSVVDAALELFARLLPNQDPSSASKAVTQLVDSTKAVKAEKNAGRRAAVIVNANTALCLALRHAALNSRQGRDALGNTKVTGALSSFLKVNSVSSHSHHNSHLRLFRNHSLMEILFSVMRVVNQLVACQVWLEPTS